MPSRHNRPGRSNRPERSNRSSRDMNWSKLVREKPLGFGRMLRKEADWAVEQQFKKKFQFRRPVEHPPVLPPLESVFTVPAYTVDQLQKDKSDLNAVKNRLNDFEIGEWHQHTRRRSSLFPILQELRHRVRAEFVTQAFAKLYECVAAYELVPGDAAEFYSVHLCEAPGAFITGLNHYLRLTRGNIRWQWFANTLNPYYEGNSMGNMITDDRFILETLDRWCFGEDCTGDIMKRENLDAITRRASEFPMVNLVTADGSIDCLDVPESQEEHVAPLHLAEAVTALKMLTQGGSFILKMFTMFEHTSVDLLYLLYVCFDELNVFKPCTSKPGNSEVYVIAKGYRRPDGIDAYLDRMFANLSSTKAMFDLATLPEDFVEQVHRCAYMFLCFQQDVIEHNIHYYRKVDSEEEQKLEWVKSQMCRKFFDVYRIKPIRPSEAILNGVDIVNGSVNINPRDHSGTYNERSTNSSLSGDLKRKQLRDKLKNLTLNKPRFNPRSKLNDRPFGPRKPCHELISLSCGKTIETLYSSKFATLSYVKFLSEVIDAASTWNVLPKDEPRPPLFTLTRATYTLKIDIQMYAALTSYNLYEKELFRVLLKSITELPLQEGIDHLIVENWLPLTQFSVGLVFFLKTYVFDGVECTSEPPILLKFYGLKTDGIASLQHLNEGLQSEDSRESPAKTVLGIVPIRLLFDGGFYYALLNYNNRLCLQYCSELLGK
uniref:Cap-specific mRNA (nucleoside-2'-O-)-methyltransferase 2 n=1 Tax=Culex pipiens TaxID=7175 RepID=A0A8D8CR54_CULPI